MLKTTDEVFSLLENLLGWAKSQSGNLQIVPEELILTDVVKSIYLLNKGNIDLKQIEFTTGVDEKETVYADLNTLKIVLRNLVSNAIKFTPKNKSISISSEKVEGAVRISVKDTGVGISAEDLPKIFNPKKHHTTYGTGGEAGSGLGLLLCQDFVLKNNGKIWVESTVGEGTTFFVELPSEKPDDEE